MIASLCSRTADLAGSAQIEIDYGSSDLDTATSRLTRTPTLDGGAEIFNGGFSHGDRTVVIAGDWSAAMMDALQYLQENYGIVGLSLPDGYYLAGIDGKRTNGTKLIVTMLIKEKLS